MKRYYAAIALGVWAVSSIPYLYGYVRQTTATRFTGIVFDVVDTAQYFAWMRAFSHQILIANPLTPEAGANRFFNLQWWLLGLLAYDTPLGFNAAYHVLRVLAVGAFAFALAAFCARALPRQPLLAFAVVMLSAGLGWVLVLAKYSLGRFWYPLDAQIAEANTYFSAMAFPHLLVAGALTLGIFSLFLDSERDGRWPRSAALFGLTLALGLSHGYDLIPATLVPGATAALLTLKRRWPRYVAPLLAIGAGAALPALYVLSLTQLDQTWKGVLSQYGNAGVFTPSPPHLLILLGVPFVLALWQVRPAAWATDDPVQTFVRVWLVLGFVLLYIPTNYQIKMLTAYQVPVGILAAQTLLAVYDRLPRRVWSGRLRGVLLAAGIAGPLLATNLYLTAWRVVDLHRAQAPYYLSSGDVQALRTLGAVAKPGDVVLSPPEIGAFVPVYSDARPFVAHWAQTLHFYERRDTVARFYAPATTDTERRELLTANRISWVLDAGSEGGGVADAAAPGAPLQPLLRGPTALYRVSPD